MILFVVESEEMYDASDTFSKKTARNVSRERSNRGKSPYSVIHFNREIGETYDADHTFRTRNGRNVSRSIFKTFLNVPAIRYTYHRALETPCSQTLVIIAILGTEAKGIGSLDMNRQKASRRDPHRQICE